MVVHYYLGITSLDQIELFPDVNYTNGKIANIDEYRLNLGSFKNYKNFDYAHISFETDWINSSNAAIVNSWWDSQTMLKFFVVDSGSITVNDVILTNNISPFAGFSPPYTELFKGVIQLEEYI